MKRSVTILFTVLLLAAALSAATLERLSLDEMIQKSTAIVRGRVVSSYAAPRGSVIYTHYRIQAIDRWKGPEGAELDVVVPGGAAGGFRQTFSGAPTLAAGTEYVLFLWTGSTGLTHVIGLSQGIFSIKPDDAGNAVAYRPAAPEMMLDASGQVVRDAPMSLRLKDLRARVQRLVPQGGAR